MRRTIISLWLAVFFWGAIHTGGLTAHDKGGFSIAPALNAGAKWRIGYYESGPYENYQLVLKAIIKGFVELGWIKTLDMPAFENPEDTRGLWHWLSQNIESRYITFVPEAYWSADWNDSKRLKNKSDCIHYLRTKPGVDLMIAMGTWAGQDLAVSEHAVPTLVTSSTDPIGAGIVKSIDDSGLDHVHARLDPTLHQRQIRLFHEFIQFKTLGIAYENTPTGKTYAAVDDVKQLAQVLGFKVETCHTLSDVPDRAKAEQSTVACYQKLAPIVDAVYITIQSGVNLSNMPQLLAPLFQHNIPTFSQRSAEEVEYGVLMSFSISDFKDAGRFHAATMARIFNGASPRDLDQVFHDPKAVALNIETGRLIGYVIPPDLLGIADPIYQSIKLPEAK